VSQQFRNEMLEECIPLKNQIIEINLSHMPVQDDALNIIAQFANLEELSLNGTKITGSNLQILESCKKLEKISLANTKISAPYCEQLGKFSSLKKVYLWQSGLSSKEIDDLAKRFPQIYWDRGSISDSTEILKLTAPLMKIPGKTIFNPSEEFSIKHPLKGVKILFTLDGSDPDSIHSPVYQQPIPIVAPTIVKARATMPGWFTSDISEWVLYAKGIKPAYAHLLNNPDPKYSIYGGESLIDGNKGESNNLMVNWLGFRNNSMKVKFSFIQGDSITKVVLSMADNIGSYIFPPESIIIKGGNDSNQLKSIGMLTPVQPAKYGPSRNKLYTVQLKKGSYRYILVEARPVASLPKWHSGRKERGWIFVDEIFFY
jgi:hypothetical protein